MSISPVVTSRYNQYVQNLPTEVPRKAAQGFAITATIQLISGSSRNTSIFAGAMAATSTIIEAVTRPIIRAIFPNYPTIAQWIQMLIPRAIALGLASTVSPWIGVSDQIATSLLPILAWWALNGNFYEANVGMVEVL